MGNRALGLTGLMWALALAGCGGNGIERGEDPDRPLTADEVEDFTLSYAEGTDCDDPRWTDATPPRRATDNRLLFCGDDPQPSVRFLSYEDDRGPVQDFGGVSEPRLFARGSDGGTVVVFARQDSGGFENPLGDADELIGALREECGCGEHVHPGTNWSGF